MKELLGLLKRSFIIIGVFIYAFASSSIFLLPIIFEWHVAFVVLGLILLLLHLTILISTAMYVFINNRVEEEWK